MGKIKISSKLRKFLSCTLAAVMVLSIALTVAYFSDREEAGLSVTANYPSYNVTYDSNGGTFDTARKNVVKYEDGIVISGKYKEPTNSNIGLYFDGWYTNSNCTDGNEFDPAKDTVKLKKDITVYAKWSVVEYTIKYNGNGGSGTMADSSHTYDVAKALTANSFTKNGYDFIGWATTAGGSVVYKDKEVVKNLTATDGACINLYAKWEQVIPVLRMWYSNTTEDFHHADYKSKITTAEFVDKANVPGDVAAGPWDVSDKKNGSVTAWLTTEDNGATYHLTIAGNGYGKIFANPESSFAFYRFTGLKTITNTSLLETGGLKNSSGTAWRVNPVYNMSSMFARCNALSSIDVTDWDTSSVNDINSMFSDCSSLNDIEGIGNWDVENIVNFGAVFANCSNLTSLDLSKWKTKSGENFNSTFSSCGKLTTIGDTTNWTTPKAENMSYMFYRCYDLTSINTKNWDVSNVSAMRSMFESCSELTSIGDTTNWCTDSLTTLARTFFDCQKLKSLNTSNWNTENVTTLESTFFACRTLTELDVSKWNTSKVTTMESTFYNCSKLGKLDVDPKEVTKSDGTKYTTWDVSKVKTLASTFLLCNSLTELDVSDWVTSSNTRLSSTFGDCESLTELDVSKWDTSNVTIASGTFADCEMLTTVGNLGNWNTSLIKTTEEMFSKCSSLKSVNISTWDMSSNTNNEHMFWYCDDLTELVIPASMTIFDEGFAALCQKLTSIQFNHPADATITFEEAGYVDNNPRLNYYAESDEYGPFFVGDPYSPTNLLLTHLITENKNVKDYLWNTDHRYFVDPIIAPYWTTLDSVSANSSAIKAATTITVLNTYNENAAMTAGPWDVSEAQNESVMAYLNGTNLYICSNLGHSAKVVANPNSQSAFSGFSSATKIDMTQLDTSRVATAAWMLSGNSSVTKYIGLDTWDTSNIINMQWMLASNIVLEDASFVNNWDVSTVFNFDEMFYRNQKMKTIDLSNWQIYNGTFKHRNPSYPFDSSYTSTGVTMSDMFSWNYELEYLGDITGWDMTNVTNTSSMFNQCNKLISLQGSGKTTTDLSNWADKVTNLVNTSQMFQQCYVLGNITGMANWKTNSLENCSQMFNECRNLTNIDINNWVTTNLKDFSGMFGMSANVNEKDANGHPTLYSKLTKLDISGWKINKTVDGTTVYGYGMLACTPITSLSLGSGWAYLPDNAFYNAMKLTSVTFEHGANNTLEFGRDVFSLFGNYGYDADNIITTTRNTSNTAIKNIVDAYDWVGDFRDTLKSSITVTYNANGGKLGSGTTNVVKYNKSIGAITEISKTDNVSADGSSYSGSYGDSIEKIEQITIPGAESLTVEITYQTENTNYDWVCVYGASVTPNSNNSYDSVSGKLGGTTKTTKTFTVSGDTAQIYFKSDSSDSSYYGYYAKVTGNGIKSSVASGSYVEPTHDTLVFDGWYTDAECSTGNEFLVGYVNSDVTVYAKWKEADPVAVYSATDKSLTFYKTKDIITEGGTYNGKAVTKVYTGFENDIYSRSYDVPWSSYASTITSVNFIGKVRPVSTKNWFTDFTNCGSFTLANLDVSNVSDMTNMFQEAGYNITGTFSLDLSNWPTGNVTSMSYVFGNAGYNASTFNLNLTGWDTSKVTSMSYMFYNAGYNASSFKITGVENWDTSKVTSMSTMFKNAGLNATYSLNLSGWKVPLVTGYSSFNEGVETKVTAPNFTSTSSTLSLKPEDEAENSSFTYWQGIVNRMLNGETSFAIEESVEEIPMDVIDAVSYMENPVSFTWKDQIFVITSDSINLYEYLSGENIPLTEVIEKSSVLDEELPITEETDNISSTVEDEIDSSIEISEEKSDVPENNISGEENNDFEKATDSLNSEEISDENKEVAEIAEDADISESKEILEDCQVNDEKNDIIEESVNDQSNTVIAEEIQTGLNESIEADNGNLGEIESEETVIDPRPNPETTDTNVDISEAAT